MKILLNQDTEQAGGGEALDPILSNDQTNTSTAMPLLPADEYTLQVVKVEQARNSRDDGNVIKIQLKTTQDATSVDGEPIAAGFPLFHTIGITPTEKYTTSSINRSLKQFMEACGFSTGSFGSHLAEYAGCNVRSKVKIQKATEEWDESNKISRFIA